MLRQILIVEDNELERRMLADILGDEYTILEAENGAEALDILSNKSDVISAIILDILMPVMDGYEVLRAVRENELWSQIPIIVTTGVNDEDVQKKALSLGANSLIFKPYQSAIARYLIRNIVGIREKAAIQESKSASLSKTFFLNKMSHDMRTPMNSIIGLTRLARSENEDIGLIHSYLDKISFSADHLMELISNCLEMQRLLEGELTLRPGPYSYYEFCRSIRSKIEPSCRSKDISFTIQELKYPHIIETDRILFEQLFELLLSNAVKFTAEGGHIELLFQNQVYKDGLFSSDYVVRDNGSGMSREFQKTMLQPFEQEHDETKSGEMGTGLGLSIAKGIVDLMGGTLTVNSELGMGTEVIVHLTVRTLSPEKHAGERTIPDNRDQLLEGANILLVDDNPVNVMIAKKLLENKRMKAYVAVNGEVALNSFAQSEPFFFDAVLMDIQMPVMDGLEATRAIRALPRLDAETVPIIALTANAFAEDYVKSFESGMNAHLCKPIAPKQMYEALAEHIYLNRRNDRQI